VKGIVNILDACIRHKVPEFLLVSSSEVYQKPPTIPTPESVPLVVPDPLNPRYSYAGGKIISEIMALNYGRNRFERVLIVRPHNVYGPDMGWEHVIPEFVLRMKKLLSGRDGVMQFPIQGTGEETRSFVFVDDFVEGLMIVLEHGTHLNIYHVGTQEEVTIAALATKVAKYFGREVAIIPGPLLGGSTVRRCPDITKVRALGFTPKIRLDDGLAVTARWYDTNSYREPGEWDTKREQ
jgi:nucleoside-diphosphate-sugar epimerase